MTLRPGPEGTQETDDVQQANQAPLNYVEGNWAAARCCGPTLFFGVQGSGVQGSGVQGSGFGGQGFWVLGSGF